MSGSGLLAKPVGRVNYRRITRSGARCTGTDPSHPLVGMNRIHEKWLLNKLMNWIDAEMKAISDVYDKGIAIVIPWKAAMKQDRS